MYETLQIMGYLPYQPVQDFSHQQQTIGEGYIFNQNIPTGIFAPRIVFS